MPIAYLLLRYIEICVISSISIFSGKWANIFLWTWIMPKIYAYYEFSKPQHHIKKCKIVYKRHSYRIVVLLRSTGCRVKLEISSLGLGSYPCLLYVFPIIEVFCFLFCCLCFVILAGFPVNFWIIICYFTYLKKKYYIHFFCFIVVS